MRDAGQYRVPRHGLQVEETLAAGDADGATCLARYWVAWDVARTLGVPRAYDLGCGAGYGCRILLDAPSSPAVTGVDISQGALDESRGTWARDGVDAAAPKFVRLDLDDPSWRQALGPPGSAPLVTCFDVLELLRHRDLFLDALAQFLEPERGVALFSANFLDRHQPVAYPDDAAVHYDAPALRRTLMRYFGVVRFVDDAAVEGRVDPFGLLRKYDGLVKRATPAGGAAKGRVRVARDVAYCAKPIVPPGVRP